MDRLDYYSLQRDLPVVNVLRTQVMFQCVHCQADFAYRNILLHHVKTKHLKPRQSYKCTLCDIEFYKRRNWDTHIMGWHCKIRKEQVYQPVLVSNKLEVQKNSCNVRAEKDKNGEMDKSPESRLEAKSDENKNTEASQMDSITVKEEELENEMSDSKVEKKAGQRRKRKEKPLICRPKNISRDKGVSVSKLYGDKPLQKIYSCDKCLFETVHEQSLKRHFKRHTKNKAGKKPQKQQILRKCPLCEYTTKFDNMNRHLRNKHRVGSFKYVNCEMCDYKTTEKWMLTRHLTMVHKISSRECDKCHERFSNYQELKHHRLEHMKGNSCYAKLDARSEAVGVDVKPKRKYSSGSAEKKQRTNSTRKSPAPNKMEPQEKTLNECKFCDKKFVRKSFLIRHMKFIHSATSEIKRENSDENESTDQDTSSGSIVLPELQCKYCLIPCLTKEALISHMRRHKRYLKLVEGEKKGATKTNS